MKNPPASPFIPRWLDELELPANEFRVLCHLWRRGKGTCFPSGKCISKTCQLHLDTVWKVLKKLESKGLITRQLRTGIRGKHNEYDLLIPGKMAQCCDASPFTSGLPETPPNGASETPKSRGAKVIHGKFPHLEGKPEVHASATLQRLDSNSGPVGPASYDPRSEAALPSKEDTLRMALDLHEKNRLDSSSPIGVLSKGEIQHFASKWLIDVEATGGFLKGSRIRLPRKALEAYLISCAQNQSKRCREMWDHS